MANTATRLITLIMLLQRQPNQKAAVLAQKLGISVRSLHRYISMLDEIGIPVYAERGPYGGFSLVRGYRMPPLVFTPEEAAAVALGTGLVSEIWGPLYQEAAQGALAKLDNVLPEEQRQEVAWARRTVVATGMRRTVLEDVAPLLRILRQAVRECNRLQMVYESSGQPEASRREVDPYALVHRWGWWYVVGYCHLRHDLRLFRLDRVRGLQPTGERFARPASFDVQAYLAGEFRDQSAVKAEFCFGPPFAHLAAGNRATWDSLEEQPDGSVLVTLLAPDLTWAASAALSFGPVLTVRAPEELRRLVAEWAAAVAAQYRTGHEA